MSGAIVLSISGSSRGGVKNRMARFIPDSGVMAVTVSNAMEKVCKLGVVLRKSGLNESRLTNQSLALAWVMSEPDNETRLKSSRDSADWDPIHWPRASTIFVKR